jgi:hypothetical protein
MCDLKVTPKIAVANTLYKRIKSVKVTMSLLIQALNVATCHFCQISKSKYMELGINLFADNFGRFDLAAIIFRLCNGVAELNMDHYVCGSNNPTHFRKQFNQASDKKINEFT